MHEGWISSLGNKMPIEDWNNEEQAHDLKVKPKERGRVICEEALRTINGERQDQYGNPEDTFAKIACLWTAYLDYGISADMVADMMILLKIAREKGGRGKRDNMVDLVGYAALGAAMRGYDA
jgi:hypothetical protein